MSVLAQAGLGTIWWLTVERGAVGDALPPGRPAPVDRRRSRRDRPPVVGPAAFVVGPPDARPVEAAEVEPGRPPGLLGAERVVGAGAVVAGALPALRPDGERQARVPLHPSQLKMKQTTHHTAGTAIHRSANDCRWSNHGDNNTLEMRSLISRTMEEFGPAFFCGHKSCCPRKESVR